MSQSKEDKLDLEFDDIIKAPAQDEPIIKEKVIKKTEQKVSSEDPLSYKLMIPQRDNTYKEIDLSTCNGEDFVNWIKAVYPEANYNPVSFHSIVSKKQALARILEFHSKSLYWLRSQAVIKNLLN